MESLKRRAPVSHNDSTSRSLLKDHCLKNLVSRNWELPLRRGATSKIPLHPFKFMFDMSKTPNNYGGLLVILRLGYKQF